MSDLAELRALVADIRMSLDSGESPRKIVDALVRDRGARRRYNCGADHLRLAGVAASCTSENHLLGAWVRAAERRIGKEAAQ
ncbi:MULTISPECIES: hypothetical protein [unclassified Sphingobium]|uniref:hypothetical protein n=1 Tax=unclassified Sphingobium TaxID=2611147 RepID=UPI0035A63AB6